MNVNMTPAIGGMYTPNFAAPVGYPYDYTRAQFIREFVSKHINYGSPEFDGCVESLMEQAAKLYDFSIKKEENV